MLRVTCAQINPTIGDIAGNIALMLAAARQARLEVGDSFRVQSWTQGQLDAAGNDPVDLPPPEGPDVKVRVVGNRSTFVSLALEQRRRDFGEAWDVLAICVEN